LKYAMTKSNHVVTFGRVRKDGSVDCDVILWSTKKKAFVKTESRAEYLDELTILSGPELKEALAVERRDAESIADAEAEEFLRDFSL